MPYLRGDAVRDSSDVDDRVMRAKKERAYGVASLVRSRTAFGRETPE